jgi:hypothetical protein
MARENGAREQMRERIAHLAARLMAEDGISDFALAKRKAARQAGSPDSRNLPTNEEVELALRNYQALYHPEEHRERLVSLRTLARDSMRLFEQFRPHLVGALVTGNIGRSSSIQVHLFTDSAKEVEMYLVNEGVPFTSRETKLFVGDNAVKVPGFAIETEEAAIELCVLPSHHERQPTRATPDGRPLPRASLSSLEALLSEGG